MESSNLSNPARVWLLAWARQSIHNYLIKHPEGEPEEVSEEVQVSRGAFVTLHLKSGPLRGCIGTFEASQPLWATIRQMAISAATRDPRFPALSPMELTQCRIEISVLSPRQPITPDQIEVGRHGLWVSRAHSRGVLLPQVASEYGWDSKRFLSETCAKAGMSPAAWKDGDLTIEAFTAEVFGETTD